VSRADLAISLEIRAASTLAGDDAGSQLGVIALQLSHHAIPRCPTGSVRGTDMKLAGRGVGDLPVDTHPTRGKVLLEALLRQPRGHEPVNNVAHSLWTTNERTTLPVAQPQPDPLPAASLRRQAAACS